MISAGAAPRFLVHTGLALVAMLPASALGDRLAARFHSFCWYLGNDVEAGKRHVPIILIAWIAANVLATPLTFAFQRFVLKSPAELGKVLGTNAGLGLLQAAFFALDWYVVQWGQRSVDWGVFSLSLAANALVVKLALDRTVMGSLLYAIAQAAVALGLVFLALFVAAERGLVAM